MFLIINITLGFPIPLSFCLFIPIVDEHFNLYIEYLSKPKLFSKYSFIFSKRCVWSSVNSIEKIGSMSVLDIKNEPSPSIKPSNQFLVITIL